MPKGVYPRTEKHRQINRESARKRYTTQSSPNKGKTWEEIYGEEKAAEMREGVKKWTKTPEVIEKANKTRKETYKKNGGLNHGPDCGCGICKAKRGETKGEGNSNFGKIYTEEEKKKKSEDAIKAHKEGHGKYGDIFWNMQRVEAALKGLMKRPTSIEKKVLEVISKFFLPYKYVGNGSFWITSMGKHINPDFLHNTNRVVVEVFEDYWKELTYGSVEAYIEERKSLFQKQGFEVIFINKKDIQKGENHLVNLLRGD
jgi:hypothetical protein